MALMILAQDFIRQLPFFKTLPIGVHQYMSLFVDAVSYLPGDVIVSAGDVVSAAYYVSQGTAIKKRKTERFGVPVEKGEEFMDQTISPIINRASKQARNSQSLNQSIDQ